MALALALALASVATPQCQIPHRLAQPRKLGMATWTFRPHHRCLELALHCPQQLRWEAPRRVLQQKQEEQKIRHNRSISCSVEWKRWDFDRTVTAW